VPARSFAPVADAASVDRTACRSDLSPTSPSVPPSGATVWFTGLPSAGKTTVARALAAAVRSSGRGVEVLDGDEVRTVLSPDLGYSRQDRDANVTRIGWVAHLLARNGVLVLASVVSPYRGAREGVRALHQQAGAAFLEVHVATPLHVCAQRDVKGLYASARAGDLAGLTGTGGRDGAYEPPIAPHLRIDTTDRPVTNVVDELLALLRKENLL